MCGIFGIVAKKSFYSFSKREYLDSIKSLYRLSETRGKEASGICALTSAQLLCAKSSMSATKFIAQKEFNDIANQSFSDKQSDNIAFIGHSRLVTDGDQSNENNNQPVITDKVVGVHNGIIVNADDIAQKYSLERKSEVDSEVLFQILQSGIYSPEISLHERMSELEGAYSIAMFFDDAENILLATNNSSLYVYLQDDFFCFASESLILGRFLKSLSIDSSNIYRVKPLESLMINLDSLSVKKAESFKGIGKLDRRQPRGLSVSNIGGETNQPSVLKVIEIGNNELKQVCTDLSAIEELTRCSKCLIPVTFPFIGFNAEGVCSFCENHTPKKFKGKEALLEHIAPHRKKDGEPDCIVNMSGGRDSSYGLHYIKEELGMNPIAYTYDWGMVTDLARRNISRICGQLGVENILVSANIKRKRDNIKKNVNAWLKKPDLGMIPLFMAGDKQYFYYSLKLKEETGIPLAFTCGNYLEKTRFKSGFAGVPEVPKASNKMWRTYDVGIVDKLKLVTYYASNFISNPAYLNSSLTDTAFGFFSSYIKNHDFCWLYEYIPWEEDKIEIELRSRYDWELATDTNTTWRIGDGTSAFYNYIYLVMAGFNENDTFLSNKIREGMISREEAVKSLEVLNKPRYETIKWYCSIIGVDFVKAMQSINNARRLY